MMKIGIINAGNIGRTLAKSWHEAGHQLKLAKAGDQTKLEHFLETIGGVKGTAREAAEFGDVALFSVYWPNLDATLAEVGDLADKIIIDTMNPLNVTEQFEHYHDLEFMQSNSTSEELQKRLPKARVVKAFSTMPSTVLDANEWANNPVKPAVFVAGDDEQAKEVVMQLARDAGFEPFDAGALATSRNIEQVGILLHHIGTHQFGGDYGRLAPTILQARELAA
ncbi:NADPH-dependent F420 reductase [Acaryochloris marina]|nr:NADPH-dependent F420 reductase [Acaryochloris marina]